MKQNKQTMKTKLIKTSPKVLAIFFAVALSHQHLPAPPSCGFGAYDRSTLSIGCKEGSWTVICETREEGICHMFDGSQCSEYEPVSGDCGDMCGAKPNKTCAHYEPITVVISGRYGTPTCSEECSGFCANATPYPPGTTATYYEISEGYCQ